MIRFVLIVVGLLVAGGVALYLIHSWRLRNILKARDEDDKDE